MNQKELGELRRRFRPDKSAISRIYGCFVNSNKEIIADLDESLGIMPQEEAEKYLGLLKKTLSGTLGKNLMDIVFSTQQVADSEECRLLAALRSSELKDGGARRALFEKVIASLDMTEGNYLILLAHDAYDVPHRGKDDELQADASDAVFSYIVCCVCPVKDGKTELGYFHGENEFHICTTGQTVSAPELGFLYPAFDDRAANLYNALFYSRSPADLHQEFIDAVFHTEAPMSAPEQKETFEFVLRETLEDECRFDVIQSVHERLQEKIEQHKESRQPEPLDISPKEISGILEDCGVSQERTALFQEKCDERFGGSAALSPENIIDSKRFEISTADVTITVPPSQSYLVETRIIDGRKYILIPADEGTTVNGFDVSIQPDRDSAHGGE